MINIFYNFLPLPHTLTMNPYKLRFPFNEFVDDKILMTQVVKQYEPKQTIANQSLLEYDNENIQSKTLKSYEPSQSQKNVRIAKISASLLQIGDA